MRIAFTTHAVTLLRQIHDYISDDSPENADRLVARIIQRAESLAEQPLRGRAVPEYDRDDVREVRERPYRIIYRVSVDEIQILSVMHERRLLPADLSGLR